MGVIIWADELSLRTQRLSFTEFWYFHNTVIIITIIIIIIIIIVFCPRANSSLQVQERSLQFFRRQVFHRKLRNQGCSFTRDWTGAVASRCFPHPTFSLAAEQNLKIWKDPKGSIVEVRRVDLANWALRPVPKFTTRVKYQFYRGFWPNRRSENSSHSSPPI